MSKKKLIVIVGPTASGKSELGVKLAKKFNGEIISADSRQIYRGLDIGTGKVPGKWVKLNVAINKRLRVSCNVFIYKNIPHYCIDFVAPKRIYTVAEYKKRAEAAIYDITSRKKLPILTGGTAFWIDAVVYDLNFPLVPPNPKLRQKLEKKSAEELLKLLRRLDSARAKTIEQKSPRRLIRAIEIAKALGKIPRLKKHSPYRTFWIGLTPFYETWSRKIRQRAKKIIGKGIIVETKKLLWQGVSKKRIQEFGFEYRAALDFVEKKISREELHQRLIRDTLDYGRRQMTWFKRNPEINWTGNHQKIEKLVKKFLTGVKNPGKK